MHFAPEGFFLAKLFELFNTAGIRYAVMRNYEPLPFSAGGSDLDLLVHEDDEDETKSILCNAISLAGGVSMGCIRSCDLFKLYAFGRNTDDLGKWWGLCVDINFGLFYRGQRLIEVGTKLPIKSY